MELATLLAQAGLISDPVTRAISTPIYQTATFNHPLGAPPGSYAYSRSANPTRSVLEQVMATLDGGATAAAFASGLAAIDAVVRLLGPSQGKRIIVTEDPYGGTIRLLDTYFRPHGLEPVYVDTADTQAVERELAAGAIALLVEIPSNPLLRVADIDRLAIACKESGSVFIVDNTFLTPYLFRPLAHGADIAVYSATKYLGGHNDLVAGVAVCRNKELGDRLRLVQNAVGAVLGPMDSWLLLRGMKTLAVRLERQQENALYLANYLASHPQVQQVLFPGLPDSPGYARLKNLAAGFGAMLSFYVKSPDQVEKVLSRVKVFSYAESLGGVESLVTFPARQTHADLAPEIRERLGINDRLLRLSIGLEDREDLRRDLEQALG